MFTPAPIERFGGRAGVRDGGVHVAYLRLAKRALRAGASGAFGARRRNAS